MEEVMFRLMKLALYVLIGYAIYEFYQGITQGGGGGAIRRAGREFGSDLEEALNQDQGRMGILTGPGRGMTTSVEDSDGGRHNTTVGRGVVTARNA
jgi:hypothetical protein